MGLFDEIKGYIKRRSDPEPDLSGEEDIIGRNQQPNGETRRNGKVVNINARTQYQVVLQKPERYEDVSGIAEHLLERRVVVLNLEGVSKDVVRSILTFLSGVVYTNGGDIKRVATSTYIITPYDVDIMGDLLGELESSGVFF